jgi:hypothetical protein
MLAALKHVWRTLRPLNVPMALMGGIALASWKHPRATRDIDLLVGATGNSNHLVQTLLRSGLRYKQAREPIRLGQLELLQFVYEPQESYLEIQIDLLLGKGPYHLEALERRIPLHLVADEFECDVLSCEDLILHKLLAGRIIDLADTAALLTANRKSLDYAYMAEWIGRLDLFSSFQQCWQSAWLNDPLPAAFTR